MFLPKDVEIQILLMRTDDKMRELLKDLRPLY